MSREYFDRYVDNAIVRWVSRRGPSPAMFAAIDASKGRRRKITVDDFHAHWDTPNLTTAARHSFAGTPYTVTSWSVTSLENWTPVWVFELSNALRVVGRAHLHSSEHSAQAVLKELFVDPGSRRRGLGSLLLAEACSVAADYGITSISAWIDEADDDPDGQPPLGEVARAFFDAHGWKSGPGRERRPVLVATRHKEPM